MAGVLFISTPPGHRTAEGKKKEIGEPSLACRTVQPAQPGEERSDLTEEAKWKRREGGKESRGSWEEEEAKRGFVHQPPLALRKQREALKWHGVHPNDERWIAEQSGEERPCGRLPCWRIRRAAALQSTHSHHRQLLRLSSFENRPLKLPMSLP